MNKKSLVKFFSILLLTAGMAHASEYRMVVPFGPGSQSDAAAREVALAFERNTKQKIVVETIPGADSIIGINHFKSTNADVIWLGPGPLVYNVVLKKDLPYDVDKDFDHILYVGTTPFYYIVGATSKLSTPKDLLTKSPDFGGINTAVGAAKLKALNYEGRTKIQPVPFKGSPEVVLAVANGTVEMGVVGITPSMIELTKAGKISIIGTTHKDAVVIEGVTVPSVSQKTGISQFSGFFAIALQPGMDPRRAEILRRGLLAAVRDAETQDKFKKLFVHSDSSTDAKQITNLYQDLRNKYKNYEKQHSE